MGNLQFVKINENRGLGGHLAERFTAMQHDDSVFYVSLGAIFTQMDARSSGHGCQGVVEKDETLTLYIAQKTQRPRATVLARATPMR
jgi:hypothetical protein